MIFSASVNPYDVLPLQPNVQGNFNNNNYSQPSSNNRPYNDNTRATYPPFDGSTKRPTFSTRQPYNTTPSGSRKF